MLYRKSHINKNLITLLLIGLVSWISFNNVVFLHAHQTGEGSIVFHAHPFQNPDGEEPGETHEHSVIEFIHINNLSLLFFEANAITDFTMGQGVNDSYSLFENTYFGLFASSLRGRAPPAC